MSEKSVVVTGESISYEGIFKIKAFMQAIKNWMDDKGYGWGETSHIESVTPEGKIIEVKLEGENKPSDYAKKKIELTIKFENIKDKMVERAKQKSRYNVGKVIVEIDAALITDYESRWKEDKPAFYLLRLFFEKHVYSSYGSKVKAQIRTDVDNLKDRISSFLNLYKY